MIIIQDYLARFTLSCLFICLFVLFLRLNFAYIPDWPACHCIDSLYRLLTLCQFSC